MLRGGEEGEWEEVTLAQGIAYVKRIHHRIRNGCVITEEVAAAAATAVQSGRRRSSPPI